VYRINDKEISVYLVLEHSGSVGPFLAGRMGRSVVLYSNFSMYSAGSLIDRDEHAVWFVYSEDLA